MKKEIPMERWLDRRIQMKTKRNSLNATLPCMQRVKKEKTASTSMKRMQSCEINLYGL